MNQQLMIDALIRRQIFIGRYANGANRRAQKELTSVLTAIRERILAGGLVEFQNEWLIDQFNAIAALVNTEAQELAVKESEFVARLLTSGGLPSAEVLASVDLIASFNDDQAELISGKKVQQLTPSGMADTYAKGEADRVLKLFRDGRGQGLSNADIAEQIDSVMKPVTRNNTNTLVRTLTNQASSVARKDTYQLNSIEQEEFIATLDKRTTTICASLSGNIYTVGAGPTLPRHWNCRSLYVPFFEGETYTDKNGQLKAKGGTGEQNYGQWLDKQSKAAQVEVLGEERAELFRSGELKIEQFTDARGVEYSLDELEQLYDLAIS